MMQKQVMRVMEHSFLALILLPVLTGCSGFFEDKQPLGIALHYGNATFLESRMPFVYF